MRSCRYTFVESLHWDPYVPDSLCEIALDQTRKATSHYKVGCAIKCDNGFVATGYSQMKTHPLQKKFAYDNLKIHLHAEIHALSRLKGAFPVIAAVVRRNKSGFANSAPCDACFSALYSFGAKKVVFFCNGNWFAVEIPKYEQNS